MTKRRHRRSPTSATTNDSVHRAPVASMPRSWMRLSVLVPLAIAIATFVVFSPAVRGTFLTWDDDRNFLANPNYRGLGVEQLQWMWTTFHLGHYVPLSWMTLGLDYTVWGMNAVGYHLTNVILHSIVAVLAFFVAQRVLDAAGVIDRRGDSASAYLPGAFAALVFALHPLRVESVAWVTERRDVLSESFCLASVLFYLKACASSSLRRRYYWVSVATFALALLSKATVVTLPAVLLLLDVYPLRRLQFAAGWWSAAARRIYLEKLPYVLLSIAAGVVAIVALPPRPQLDVESKLAVSAYSLCLYLWKTIAPFHLSPLYQMPRRIDAAGGVFLLSYVVLALVSAGVFALRRKYPGMLAAWIAFVIITLPMLGVVQNGPQIAADRYTYHAGLALAIPAAAAFAWFDAKHRPLARSLGAAILVMLGALSWRQAHVWRDSRSFWAYTLQREPGSALASVSLANEIVGTNLPDALVLYGAAVRIDPAYPVGENDYAVALRRAGRLDDAVAHFRRAAQLQPSYADAHSNLGSALSAQGKTDDAIAEFQRALALDPELADAHFNWANALFKRGDLAGAITHYQLSLRLRPDDADAASNLATARGLLRASEQRAP